MSRGNQAGQAISTSYVTIYDADTDGPLTAFGIEADIANTTRTLVRWTHSVNRTNLASLAAGGDYKIFRGGKGQVTKVEVATASSTGIAYMDVLGDHN